MATTAIAVRASRCLWSSASRSARVGHRFSCTAKQQQQQQQRWWWRQYSSSTAATTRSTNHNHSNSSNSSGTDKVVSSDDSSYTTTASGLVYYDEVVGWGRSPEPGDQVTLHYNSFDYESMAPLESTYRTTHPLVLWLGEGVTCAGVEEGVATMREGGQRVIIMTPELAWDPQLREERHQRTDPVLMQLELVRVGLEVTLPVRLWRWVRAKVSAQAGVAETHDESRRKQQAQAPTSGKQGDSSHDNDK